MRLLLAAFAIPTLLAAQTRLLVISIDGLDARFLNEPALRVKAPNLRRLMREGASATVVGVAPSETWPAHASLVTGVSPWQHGVLTNDQAYSSFKTGTIWDAAAKNGLKAAAVFWPGTLGANLAFNLPELNETHRGNPVSFDAIAQKSAPAGLAGQVEKQFPSFAKELWTDSSSAQAALYLMVNEKPDVLLVHFAEVDTEEHETGALSIYSREIVENDDDLVGQLLAKKPRGTIVVVVSDHGFESSNRSVRPQVLVRQAGLKGRVEIENGLIGTSDPAVATVLRKALITGRKSGLAREVPLAEIRAKAPMILNGKHAKWVAAFDTLPDAVATAEDRGPAMGQGPHLGVHNLWPDRPGFRSVFIASGDGIRPLKLGEIDMLQIAPTLADVLGLKLMAAKSTSLWRQISK